MAEPPLDLLDGLVKSDLGIIRRYAADALRIDKDDLLALALVLPDDEIRVEVAGFEEADATALAQIAQQVKFSLGKVAGVGLVERLQILDELSLALVQGHWRDFDRTAIE